MEFDHVAVFDRASETYDSVGVEFFSAFGRKLCAEAELRAGESVLDIGTGRGAVLFPAAEAVGSGGRVVGMDLAAGMVRRTLQDCADRGLRHCEVILGDAADPPLNGGETFDAVLSSFVIFFLDNPAGVMSRWAALVAPGGRLGLATFVDDADDVRFTAVLKRYFASPPPDAGNEPDPFQLVRDPVWLDDALAIAGLPSISSATVRHPTVFADTNQAMHWMWSHGMRAGLEQLSAKDLAAVTADIAKDLESNRLPDGRLGFHSSVRFTIGRR